MQLRAGRVHYRRALELRARGNGKRRSKSIERSASVTAALAFDFSLRCSFIMIVVIRQYHCTYLRSLALCQSVSFCL